MRRLIAVLAMAVVPNLSFADNIDPAFDKYYSRFMEASFYYGVEVNQADLIIKFGIPAEDPHKQPGKIRLGSCTVGGGQPSLVIVRKETWDKFGDSDREALIFHELGHCLLRRLHKDDKTNMNEPVSLMHHEHIGGKRYSDYREYYERELFWGAFKLVPVPQEMGSVGN